MDISVGIREYERGVKGRREREKRGRGRKMRM